ncbi:MAG: alanine--tRNA ligase-related protein, partial [Pseudolysinimonas sp.]
VEDTQSKGASTLPGDTVFLLHDTFGFPIDLTLEIAEEAGLTVDRAAFDQLMTEQRTRAKTDAKAKKRALADLSVYSEMRAAGETVFTGYDYLQTDSRVLGILVDGQPATSASTGEIAEVILAETALYPESGGQAADAGAIVGNGFDLEVLDVQRPVKGLISHTVQVRSGEVSVGAEATSVVDPVYRHSAAQAHSATHLVHAALRQTLGSEAHQSGSYNKAGYMRLDFAWNQALSAETRSELEEIANNAVRDNLEVTTRILPIAEAKAAGAMALFGEKYGDTVRMVDIGGPWSRELCAGTHVRTSAEVGLVNLVSESSVGSANRRVEALVGLEAFRDLAAERALVSTLTSSLKVPRELLPQRIESLVAELKAAEKKIASYESAALSSRVPSLVKSASRLGKYLTVIEDVGALSSADELRSLATAVRERLGTESSVVALAAHVDGKPAVIVATSPGAREHGAKAGVLAKQAAGVLGGGGGGKDDLAQGGGTDIHAIGAALSGIAAALDG